MPVFDAKLRNMDYYVDRGFGRTPGTTISIANDVLRNKIRLFGGLYLEPTTLNIFETELVTEKRMSRLYLFAMDFMSYLISAYKETKDNLYMQKFDDILGQFFEYCDRVPLALSKQDDLIPFAQSVMLIKALHIFPDVPHMDKIKELLYKNALYCLDDKNHNDENYHGLFTDLGLLHLAVLFEGLPESLEWRTHAIKRASALYKFSFYDDGCINENSLTYFGVELKMYEELVKFCRHYLIPGTENMDVAKSRRILETFARTDNSCPAIGVCNEVKLARHNNESAVYHNIGLAVIKVGKMYCSVRYKTNLHSHAHIDDASITLRYKDIDIALDSGQFSFDPYHPINRFGKSSSGHSGIYPIFVDGLSLGEYISCRKYADAEVFNIDRECGLMRCGYVLDAGDVKVYREVKIEPKCVTVKDSWENKVPVTMRQRFVLPKTFIEKSSFAYSKKTFKTEVDDTTVKYEVVSILDNLFTTVNFGVMCERNFEYEPTLLLDSIAENSLMGEVTTIITINPKEANV